jgi:dUTP pyrophosphatase
MLKFLQGVFSKVFALNKKPSFLVQRLDEKAILPRKVRDSDSGYDVSALTLEQVELTNLWIADFKIAVKPPKGWYFDLVGRSSLPTKGWHFVGGVGVIDQTYTGSVKMVLQKIDGSDLPELPFSCGQLILRPVVHFDVIETDALPVTDRGSGGFGSTDKKVGA